MNVPRSQRLVQKLINGTILRQTRYQSSASSLKTTTRPYDEVSIPAPWGHIAGKWYGPKDVRPILGMHGWMDNAGTFDTLAPLLPPHVSLLTIDAPGHGLSSWLPKGVTYHSVDLVQIVLRVMKIYKWDKVSLLGHSMSSINGFVFAATYPDKLDMLIGLDVLKPLIRSEKTFVDKLSRRLEENLKLEDRHLAGSEPPAYKWDQLVERLHLGSDKSIELDACQHLLQRSCKPSTKDPSKYYFSRDSRLKGSIVYMLSNDAVLEMASRITAPYLFIKALQAPYYEDKKYYDDTVEVLRKNPLFEYHEVEGSHHVHLNEPEKVVHFINDFINKYRPALG